MKMKKSARLFQRIILGFIVHAIVFLRVANAAENPSATPADAFLQQREALTNQWEAADKAFAAARSVYGRSKDELNGYVAQRKTLSDQAKAWNKRVSQAGLFLPRLSFETSNDKQRVNDYLEFCKKVAEMEKAADRPMDMEKADTLSAELKSWANNGNITVTHFAQQAVKIETRARENADLTCRLILAADQPKAQEMFDKNTAMLNKYLPPKKFSTLRGIVFGYTSRERASELSASAADGPAKEINVAQIRIDSASNAQARAARASRDALAARKDKDRVENDRIAFLTHACAVFDSLKDPVKVGEAAIQFIGGLERHNADSDDGKILEARRDKRIKELDEQAKAAQKAEAAARAEAQRQAKAAAEAEAARLAEAQRQAKAAREAEAARQRAEEQRRRMLADADAAITAKRYEQAGTLVNQYKAAGGDTAIAGQFLSRIVSRRNADMEAATSLLINDLQAAVRRALGAASASDIKAEAARINAVPAEIRQRGADSLKVVAAVASALKRVEPVWILAQQGDSLKAAWDNTGKWAARALSVSGAPKEELGKWAAERGRLSASAKDWNKKTAQNESNLPRLGFDATRDAQETRAYLDFSAKVEAVKKEAARPMSFGKADTLLDKIKALAKNERIKADGSESIASDIKTQAGITAAKTDSLILMTLAANPPKAQEILNRNCLYLDKYGTRDRCSALQEKIRVEIQIRDTRNFIGKRITDFRNLLGRSDTLRARATLTNLDSSVRVLKALDGRQAKPLGDTLNAFESALSAKKKEMVASAKRAEDSLLVLQKQRESRRLADSTRTVIFRSAKVALYKVLNSAQVDSIMQPHLEALGRLQAEEFSSAAMKDLRQQITERTRDLASQEKAAELAQAKALAQARADSLAKAKAEALAQAKALAQARADSLAKAKAEALAKAKAEAEALAQAKAIEQARADSLAKIKAEELAQAKAAAQARADSLARAKAEALAQAKALAQARADSLAKAKAEALAQAKALAQARADSLAKAKAEALAQAKAEAEALAQAKAIEQARADSLAKIKAEELAQAKAAAQARADSLARAKAEALAQAKAAAQARADSLARAKAEALAQAKAAAQARADSLALTNARIADSLRMASADSLMAAAYPALFAVRDMAEMRKVLLPIIESMKALKVDPKDIQDFREQAKIKKQELDSLAKLNTP